MTKPKPSKKTKRDDRPPESDSSKSFTGDNTHCLIQDAVKLAVSEEIRGLRLRVDEQQYELERMSRLLETKEEKILHLEGKIVTSDHKDLDEKVNAMARQIHIELNEIEQYSRKGCIRIYGLNVHPNTNYVSAVLHFLQNKLNINLHPHDLVAVHPLPRRTSSNKDSPPPIFVKFVRYTDKSLVIRERRNLRGKGISIHEDMTHKNRLLLNRVTIDDRFEKAWFSNGSVWGLLKDVNKKVRVNLYQSCDDAIKDAERFEPINQQLRGNPGQADLRHPNSYNAFRPRTPQQRLNNPIPIERRLGNIAGMTMTHNFPLFASTPRQIDTQQHVGRTVTQSNTSPVLSPTQSAQTVSPVTQSAQTVSPAEIADNSSIPPTNLQPMSPPTHPTTASQPHQPANSSSTSVPVSVTTQETTSQTNTSGNILLSAINDHIQGQGMSNAAEMQT